MNIKHFIREQLTKISNQLFYSGSRYQCITCGSGLRKFIAIGEVFPVLKDKNVVGGGLRYAGCPICYSTDRERLIHLYLRDYYEINKKGNIKVLHIAPEKGLINYFQSLNNITYICGDKFTQGYHYPKFVENMDITSIHYEANSFDMVICNHVLEHIIDDKKAIAEIFRVLKPGGNAILQVPLALAMDRTIEDYSIVDHREREKLYGQFDHVRLYGKDYKDRLESAGFMVEMVSLEQLGASCIKFGLNSKEELHIAKKI